MNARGNAWRDYRLPDGWRASVGRLTLVAPVEGKVADFGDDPHHLVRGSVATPPDGIRAKILTEAQFLAGEDARGTLVVLEPETFPRGEVLTAILDRGGLGFVTDFTPDRFERPDEVPEIVGATETDNPEVDAATRPFVGFAVTPRVGVHLRTLASVGNLFARIECDGVRGACTEDVAAVVARREAFVRAVAEADVRPAVVAGPSRWRDYASGIVATRLFEGPVRDQVCLDAWERVGLPLGSARLVFDAVVAALDGSRDLAAVLSEKEAACGCVLSEPEVKRLVLAVTVLGEKGYFRVTDRGAVSQADLVAAIRKVGVVRGDLLLVHSALSAFGHIVGGAGTVLAALAEAVGPDGTVLLPSFRRSSCLLNGINKKWEHRPSDIRDDGSPSMRKVVGALTGAFLRAHPDAPRGAHVSHPWTGFGPKAAEIVLAQRRDEPPASESSALGAALRLGGKILHLGSPVGHTTFLHYLETRHRLPGLGPGYYAAREADGSVGYVYVKDHVPGPRDWYAKNEDARFFRAALAHGLEIRETPLGLGTVKLMDCRQLWDIGSALVAEDRRILIGT